MVVHVLVDIAKEASCDDRNHTSRNTAIIHPHITLSIRNLPRQYHDFPGSLIAGDAGHIGNLVDETDTGQFNDFAN